ncbi:hypothetical protein ACFFJT_04215 [Dyella flava]|uniref:Uncharacterized protein n=1 Tax=Dyella flava TaxID=1920170 RepID=A0ABS2K675_9GAMM|nr:hypothetical protein [Dyella flava]MBM7126560.1 hypothetical protein [Dyella flava]GLQ49620.1 hypothetical protein GCM10010872_10690 [Dyella flava]
MSRTLGVRKALLAGFVALSLTSTVFAQTSTPATGLGQSWPNAADLSASSNWHVYVFVLNGVEYIQINDLNGTVHAAIAAANGGVVVLPMGIDSQNVQTTASGATSTAQTVYSDATTTVMATPQSNGTTQFVVEEEKCDNPVSCSAVEKSVSN